MLVSSDFVLVGLLQMLIDLYVVHIIGSSDHAIVSSAKINQVLATLLNSGFHLF